MAKKLRFSGGYRNNGKKKLFAFFLVSYIFIQKKKSTSEQFLQGRPS